MVTVGIAKWSDVRPGAEAGRAQCRSALLGSGYSPPTCVDSDLLPGQVAAVDALARHLSRERTRLGCRGSSVVPQDSLNSEKLFYPRYGVLWQDTDRTQQRERLLRTESRRNQARASRCPWPLDHGGSALPATVPGHTYKGLLTMGVHRCLGVQVLCWESALEAWSSASLTLSAQAPAPQRSHPCDGIQSPRGSSRMTGLE